VRNNYALGTQVQEEDALKNALFSTRQKRQAPPTCVIIFQIDFLLIPL